jgi:hypothetical protein
MARSATLGPAPCHRATLIRSDARQNRRSSDPSLQTHRSFLTRVTMDPILPLEGSGGRCRTIRRPLAPHLSGRAQESPALPGAAPNGIPGVKGRNRTMESTAPALRRPGFMFVSWQGRSGAQASSLKRSGSIAGDSPLRSVRISGGLLRGLLPVFLPVVPTPTAIEETIPGRGIGVEPGRRDLQNCGSDWGGRSAGSLRQSLQDVRRGENNQEGPFSRGL